MKQIVVLIRDLDQQEILEVKNELKKKDPILTDRYFYPIRDEHYDEGFRKGALFITDDAYERIHTVGINIDYQLFLNQLAQNSK